MFRKLCGENAAKNVALVTTKWSHVQEEVGRERERQLCEIYWKDMLDRGSSLVALRNDRNLAWDIVTAIAEKIPLEVIQIQRELVDLGKNLPETQACIALLSQLNECLKDQRAIARALRKKPTPEAEAEYIGIVQRIEKVVYQIRNTIISFASKLKNNRTQERNEIVFQPTDKVVL
jgi:hypothetical protein